MAEQHANKRSPPLPISRSPFESDPTALPGSTVNPYVAEYDMHAGDHGLPALDFNPRRPQMPQNTISPDQRLSPFNSSSVVAPSLVRQPFEPGSTRNPPSMRPFPSKDQPNLYQPKHIYASPYPSAPLASSNLHLAESHRSCPQTQPQTQIHAPEVAHHNQSSSHGPPAQRAGASTVTYFPNPDPFANETEDHLFTSYAQAKAERDRLFREPLNNIDGDDVELVDQHKGRYVLAIVQALKHKDFLPPPETKRIRQKNADGTKAKKGAAESIVSLDDSDRAKWLKWQKDGQKIVEGHLDQPKRKADTLFHFQAWKVVNEAVKIHRQGFLYTNQKTDEQLKCSSRLEEAVQVIKEYSRVRAKLLDGDKIPNFCVSPQAYAKVTRNAFWNNSTRAKTPASDAKPSQRVAKKDGALAGKYGEGRKKREKIKTKAIKQNKSSAKTKSDSTVGTGSSLEQETSSAISSTNMASDLSSPVDADVGEEYEDAEGEIDDDAIAERLADNAAPTFNSTYYRQSVFGYVPGIPSPHDNDAFPDPFGNISASMSAFRPQTQPSPHGSGTSGAFELPA